MVSQTITLTNGSGLHMRPAGVLASAMAPFASDVTIVAADKEVNAKSLMELLLYSGPGPFCCCCLALKAITEILTSVRSGLLSNRRM